jgi:hypothetical protein
MRRRNLPTIDAGYWAAIVAASICGTNTGDLAAGPLGMGHVRGIIPLTAIFLAVVWAEKLLNLTTVAFYWLAIIVLRTMATNIADFATHDLKLSYAVFVPLLAACRTEVPECDFSEHSVPSGTMCGEGGHLRWPPRRTFASCSTRW